MAKPRATLTRVPGLRVGHAETSGRDRTGVTAVLFDAAAPTVVKILGGATATYDTASLDLSATFGRRWALFFSGGSVFGLDAARGVRTRVLETGGGHSVFGNSNRVAPVSGAALFDLPSGPAQLPDYTELGYAAARSATKGAVAHGPVGAGAGARVGKYLGRARSDPGGVGSAARRLPGVGWVGALAAVNSVGAIRDPSTGAWVAGARDSRGAFTPPESGEFGRRRSSRERGTTLLIVVTDAPLDRPGLERVASFSATGMARAV
ncbi:MAG: P1 family peptidase, partial [Thermoplasmata archaeon]|nr:P1 family peptidase [Thermoplasmata archaeon]